MKARNSLGVMMINKKMVQKVADLACLQLQESKIDTIEVQFNKILSYFADLQKVDTAGVEPMVTPHDLTTALRADVVCKELTVEELLKNAPEVKNALFKVPPVV